MIYYHDDKHRIAADFAYRIGKIALQYSDLELSPEDKYSDTLHLCLLQSLLTNCKELEQAMLHENGDGLGLYVPLAEKPEWGLDSLEIIQNSFEGNVTISSLIYHLRNAMSHPTGTDLESNFPSTGYNSIKGPNRQIAAIGFCDSPDVKNNRWRTWRNHKAAMYHLKKNSGDNWNHIPDDVDLYEDRPGVFGMYRFGEKYARVFQVNLTIEQLRSLVINLANLLAQPINEQWDGKTVRPILAA